MGAFAVGEVILFPFPHSDLSKSKLRPAVVVADLAGDDCILCAITSRKPFSLEPAVEISGKDFSQGGLQRETSFIRPTKLFTADTTLIKRSVGQLKQDVLAKIMLILQVLFTP